MTEPSMTPPTTDSARAVPAAPAKPGRSPMGRPRVVGFVVTAVVTVAGITGARFVIDNMLGPDFDDYQIGTCVDVLPLSSTPEPGEVPDVVDCEGASAEGKIVGAFEGKRLYDRHGMCPRSAVSAFELISGDDSLLVCLKRW
jgi:hypothetical protein